MENIARGKTGLGIGLPNGNVVSTMWPDKAAAVCLLRQTGTHTSTHTHVCTSVRGILYIPFPYVCIFFFLRRRRRLHLHSMNETLFFFLVLSYSLFYSVPRLFHNAGMAGFCNPFWNIVDVLYSYIYRIYIIYYCCFMQIKFSSVFYNLKFFF